MGETSSGNDPSPGSEIALLDPLGSADHDRRAVARRTRARARIQKFTVGGYVVSFAWLDAVIASPLSYVAIASWATAFLAQTTLTRSRRLFVLSGATIVSVVGFALGWNHWSTPAGIALTSVLGAVWRTGDARAQMTELKRPGARQELPPLTPRREDP